MIGRGSAPRSFSTRERQLPDVLVACVGGGSNAIGMFHPFLRDAQVRLIGVEAGGKGDRDWASTRRALCRRWREARCAARHVAATSCRIAPVRFANTHSISAGLDYPAIGPEHAFLRDRKRVEYVAIDDADAAEGFELLAKLEGIIPALESAHAVAYAVRLASKLPANKSIVINLSGRGDKDLASVQPLVSGLRKRS